MTFDLKRPRLKNLGKHQCWYLFSKVVVLGRKGLWLEDVWVGLGLVAGNEKLTRPVWNLAKFVKFIFCILLWKVWIHHFYSSYELNNSLGWAFYPWLAPSLEILTPGSLWLMGMCEPLKTQWLKFLNHVTWKKCLIFLFFGWMKVIQLIGSGMECPSCKSLNRWN